MYKVMLVEDEPPILNMIKDIINSGDNEFMVSSWAYNGRDALKLLENEVPDVIITDIRMPFMDGLELISQVNKLYPQVSCIILSGYSDFEYARSAIRLKVFDYLLKPIEPEALTALMTKLFDLFEEQKARNEYDYLDALINFQNGEAQESFRMQYPFYFVIVAFAGHLSNQLYDVINPGKDFWDNCDMAGIEGGIREKCLKLWRLNGKYINEKIFVIAGEDGKDNFIKEICSKLMLLLRNDRIPINLISGSPVKEIGGVGALAKRLLGILSREMVFGKSNIYFETEQKATGLFLTPAIEKQLSVLVQQSSLAAFKSSLKAAVYEWKEQDYTQLALQTLINHMINLFQGTLSGTEAGSFNGGYDVNQIIAGAFDYETLYENICCVFKDLFDLKNKNFTGHMSAKELVEEIERYLKENYTSNITYRLFYEMFGYNETYITNVFKNTKGISPSKYVTRLRIEKAKEIITRQPEVRLKNVSEMVGYEDPLYFSRVFKDLTGVSPSDYAKALK